MSEVSRHIDVFLDLLPNWPKNDQTRENFRELLRERFEASLPENGGFGPFSIRTKMARHLEIIVILLLLILVS